MILFTTRINEEDIFTAIKDLYAQCRGAYACVAMIAGYGIIGFRDPHGIRPLVLGRRKTETGYDYMFASESVCLDALGFTDCEDINPGKYWQVWVMLCAFMTHFIFRWGCYYYPWATLSSPIGACRSPHSLHFRIRLLCSPRQYHWWYLCLQSTSLHGWSSCSTSRENVWWQVRYRCGHSCKYKVYIWMGDDETHGYSSLQVPDTSRVAALQASHKLNILYREGFNKNRYVGRTFIMPGQQTR